MEDPIFIVGLPRTGSTVWHNIFARDTQLCIIDEILFLSPWRRDFRYFLRTQVGNLASDHNVRTMVELMFSDSKVPGLSSWFWIGDKHRFNSGSFRERLCTRILASDRSLGSIFKCIIEQITECQGLPRCCVKFPVYPSYISQLLEWYPHCKIVHITRDPRATAASKTSDPGGTKKLVIRYPHLRFVLRKLAITFVVFQYIWTSHMHRHYRSLANYALFRYEDLLVDTEAVIKRLCNFVEIDFCPKMMDLRSTQKSSVRGSRIAGVDKRVGRHWDKVLTPFEERLVSLLTARAMRRLEFDPERHVLYASDL